MNLSDYMKINGFSSSNPENAQDLRDLILKLVEISRPVACEDEVFAVRAIAPFLGYRLGNDIPILSGCGTGRLSHEELYNIDKSVLKTAIEQICEHSKKIRLEISDKKTRGQYYLEFAIKASR